MLTPELTPELTAYAAKIVAERGIKRDELTPEMLGDVLIEAAQRMDAVVCEIIEGRSNRAKSLASDLSGAIYIDVVARQSLQ